MVIVALWLLLLGFLIYGAILLGRLRREDPSLWPEVFLGPAGARLRIHPAWKVENRVGFLRIVTGIENGLLVVEAAAHEPIPPSAPAPPEARLRDWLSMSGITFDSMQIESFVAPAGAGARLGSAGTEPSGERRYFEFHLITGPAQNILFRYCCPVLAGSFEALSLARAVASLRFDPARSETPAGPTQ